MTIKNQRKRKDENIISGVGKKDEGFFLDAINFSFSLSFYLIKNHIPHTLTSPFVS
jgi:hypothetical protein